MADSAACLRRAVIASSVVWAGGIPLAAAAAALTNPPVVVYLGSTLVYAIGSVVCHQLPERSFYLWGRQFAVCARCAGIYFGTAAFAVAFAGWRSRRSGRAPSARARTVRLLAGGAALAINFLTLVYEWTTGAMPTNAVRAAAGSILGAAVAALIVYDVN